jgi:hypothetical protein
MDCGLLPFPVCILEKRLINSRIHSGREGFSWARDGLHRNGVVVDSLTGPISGDAYIVCMSRFYIEGRLVTSAVGDLLHIAIVDDKQSRISHLYIHYVPYSLALEPVNIILFDAALDRSVAFGIEFEEFRLGPECSGNRAVHGQF